jgi:hypothetical protein
MRTRDSFQLQFAPAQIRELAARYRYQDDCEALEAGARITAGEYSRTNLEVIFRWKTGGRGISRLARNTEAEIEDTLRLAVGAQTERAAMAVLCGLCGVGVPVASAVLTAINPLLYTIIDFRALESLGINNYYETIDFYLEYLEQCRELALRHAVPLRELDRALWQWSKEQPPAE